MNSPACGKFQGQHLESWWRCAEQPLSCADMMMMEEEDPHKKVNSSAASICASPSTAAAGSSPKKLHSMKSFMNGIVSPFMSCVHPPLGMCGSVSGSSPRHNLDGLAWQQASPQRSDCYIFDTHANTSNPEQQQHYHHHHHHHPSVVLTSSLPLTNIETCHIHCNDILCGRGYATSKQQHVGNRHFRDLITANKAAYDGLTKKQKLMFARSIVDMVHSTRPAGRFLMKDVTTGLWSDIGMARSLEKTSQALREAQVSPSVSAGQSSRTLEDRSVALTVLSESIASVSTTVASNHSQKTAQSKQVIIPPHLRHVYRIAPRQIPDWIDPRDGQQEVPDNSKPNNNKSFQYPPAPATPLQLSPLTMSVSHDGPSYMARSQPHTQYSPRPQPVSPSTETPSTPPSIWRLHRFNSPFGSLPDIFRSSSTISHLIAKPHTMTEPSFDTITTEEWNGIATTQSMQSSTVRSDLLIDQQECNKRPKIQSALSLDERVVGRERGKSALGTRGPSRSPSSVSRQRNHIHDIALSTTDFLGLNELSVK